MSGKNLERLIAEWLEGRIAADDSEILQHQLQESPEARATFRRFAELDAALREVADAESSSLLARVSDHELTATRSAPWVKWIAIAAMAVVAMVVSANFFRPSFEPDIAEIAGLSGPLRWTGNGGRVSHELIVGSRLSGGTIDGMSPKSWFALEFNDGSTVMISGNSMLTFSDHGQKILHLKEGSFAANVKPQPPAKPMLVHTPTATLELVGTQFDVDAGDYSMALNVSAGEVRVERLSDGSSVEVPAGYRVLAAPDHELTLVPIPESVSGWTSRLYLGPRRSRGRWSPGTKENSAQLTAVPYFTEEGTTIYTVGLSVSSGDTPPVVLQPDSSIRVRGSMESSHSLYVGMTVRKADGDFAGRFQTIRPPAEFESGQNFDIVLRVSDFRLDPSLKQMGSRLPSHPLGLIVESIWCHTLFDSVELAIADVELIPPDAR